MNNLSKRQSDILAKIKAHILTFNFDEELTFNKIYSGLDIDFKHEDEFYDMLFLLTRGKDAIIEQRFKVWNERILKYCDFDNSALIKGHMRAQYYINPISNKVLSIDEYGKEVIIHFKRIK